MYEYLDGEIWECGIAPDTGTHYYRDTGGEVTTDRITKHVETAHGIRPSSDILKRP